MDELALELDVPVFAQTAGGSYKPVNIGWQDMIDPVEFEALLEKATLLVAHAGIGSVLTAEKHHKPIVIFPRQASLGEHRNDHQLATSAAMENYKGIYVARTKDELRERLSAKLAPQPDREGQPGRQLFIQKIAGIIDAEGEKATAKRFRLIPIKRGKV